MKKIKQKSFQLIATFVLVFVTNANAQDIASPKNSGVPVIDPFSRNVNRAIKYGTVQATDPKSKRNGSDGGQSYQSDEDFARLPDLRSYRVVSLSVKPPSSKPLIFGPELSMPQVGTSPRKAYLQLDSFASVALAKQYILDFYEDSKKYIDANIVIRPMRESGGAHYRVDLGPFVSERHARLFCMHVLSNQKNCSVSREHQSNSERSTFTSTGTLGLSTSMVQQVMLTNSNIDAGRLYSAIYEINEGDTLGKDDFVIIKITKRGVYLAAEPSKVFLIPTDILPLPSSADDASE